MSNAIQKKNIYKSSSELKKTSCFQKEAKTERKKIKEGRGTADDISYVP